jgi:Ca2+-binding RTX toxin-like protein
MTGGLGNDTYLVDSIADIVTEAANAGTDTVQSSVSYTIADNVENLTLTGTAAINGTGNSLNNIIAGNSGDNTLNGAAGNDTMIGGLGNDTYLVNSTGDIVTEVANAGTDTVQSSITYSLGANVENLTLTGTVAINGTGNSANNVVTGNSANNSLNGGAGNDSLNGGLGDDTLVGGVGNDSYSVDSTGDVVTELVNEGIDTVQAAISYSLGANLENLTLSGTTAINGTGNDVNNVVTGNSANNSLSGGAGNDTIVGGAGDDMLLGDLGDDSLSGGLGNDLYQVDSLGDVVTELASQGTDTVQSALSYSLGNNLENLTLTGIADINATGNSLANILTGNAGNNILTGGAGNDTLSGGAGNDQFGFSSGAAFTVPTMGTDTIADFSLGSDQILLSKTTFSALTSIIGTGFSDASEFAVVSSDAAAGTAVAKIVYNSGNGKLFYNQNGATAGVGTGGNFAVLTANPALSANDFVIQA